MLIWEAVEFANQGLNPDPLETVTHQAARLTALRDYLKWLQQFRPELYGALVTEF